MTMNNILSNYNKPNARTHENKYKTDFDEFGLIIKISLPSLKH